MISVIESICVSFPSIAYGEAIEPKNGIENFFTISTNMKFLRKSEYYQSRFYQFIRSRRLLATNIRNIILEGNLVLRGWGKILID